MRMSKAVGRKRMFPMAAVVTTCMGWQQAIKNNTIPIGMLGGFKFTIDVTQNAFRFDVEVHHE